jgi:hypothetical protein
MKLRQFDADWASLLASSVGLLYCYVTFSTIRFHFSNRRKPLDYKRVGTEQETIVKLGCCIATLQFSFNWC